jgi:hypothetical protein
MAGTAAADDGAIDNDRILTNMEEIMFGSEFVGEEADFVRRWEGPLRVAIYASEPDRYRDLLAGHLERLGALTGLDMAIVESRSPEENAHLLVLGREQFYAYADRHLGAGKNPRTNTFLACYGFFKLGAGGRIGEAFAVLPNFIGEAEMRACIVEEMTQLMGLPNDSFDIAPSIFNDDDEHLDLTWQDELFLRVLYDRRVRSGMTRAEFAIVARQILDELRPPG